MASWLQTSGKRKDGKTQQCLQLPQEQREGEAIPHPAETLNPREAKTFRASQLTKVGKGAATQKYSYYIKFTIPYPSKKVNRIYLPFNR